MTDDPFVNFRAAQRQGWSLFAPLETFTTIPAAKLVRFARVAPGEAVLDVGCGTGVVAVTAARAGAKVRALDLAPALLERARQNAAIAEVTVDFTEGDAEALPYADATFDVVLSQFGHMFAPRPEVALDQMLRVLKPGGRIAFATWPPDLFAGALFGLLSKYLPAPAPGAAVPAPPPQWGDPNVVRARFGARVRDIVFDHETMITAQLSPQHARLMFETTLGPLVAVVASLQTQPERLAQLRKELDLIISRIFSDNHLRQSFLLSRAVRS
jgi:SAM-dependent methyltransferase